MVASSASVPRQPDLRSAWPLQLEAGGEDITIGEEDLTPEELQEFRRALAAGQLSGLVEPWQPWWLTDAAAQLQLGPGGTALVAETGERLCHKCPSQMLQPPQHALSSPYSADCPAVHAHVHVRAWAVHSLASTPS